jgi:outer membrane protein OmpA-like peptidoglycan-associated protein
MKSSGREVGLRVRWAIGLACCLWAAAVGAQNNTQQAPIREATVADFIDALRDRTDRAYNYKQTAPPDTKTNLCADQAVVGASNSAAAASRLGVVAVPAVPFAGGDGPKVDLAVQFAEGRDSILPAGEKLLNTLRKALEEPSLMGARIALAGHADTSGNELENLKLSCARALEVRRFLIDRGIEASRLTAYGFGSSRLLESHKGEPRSPIHRRVEVRRAP